MFSVESTSDRDLKLPFSLIKTTCQVYLGEGGELVVGDGDVEGVCSCVEALEGDDGALVAVDLEEVRLLLRISG